VQAPAYQIMKPLSRWLAMGTYVVNYHGHWIHGFYLGNSA